MTHASNPLLGPLSRDEFITENMPLVYKIARSYERRAYLYGIACDDLVQEGALGLILAYDRYSNDEIAFSTYAYHYINGRIRDYVRNYGSFIRPSKRLLALCQRIVDADLFGAPDEAVAKELGVSEKQVQLVRLYLAVSRPSPIEIGEDGEMNVPTEADDLTHADVDEFTAKLTERQRQVVRLLANGRTQTEAANELGLSRQAVRSIVLSVRPHYLRYSAA